MSHPGPLDSLNKHLTLTYKLTQQSVKCTIQSIENRATFWYNSLNLDGNVLISLAPIFAIQLVFVASPLSMQH
jgi:hypothetical protein